MRAPRCNCGHVNRIGNNFCTRCGERLAKQEQEGPRSSSGKGSRVGLITAGVVVLVIMGGCVATDSESTSTSTPTVTEAEKKEAEPTRQARKPTRNPFPTLSPVQKRVVCLDLKMTVREAPSTSRGVTMKHYLVREFNLTSERELDHLLSQCRIRLQ